MKDKSQDLLLIEKMFHEISNGDPLSSIDTIKRTLSRMYDLDIEISIINNKSNTFFGMTVYPNKEVLDHTIDTIMNNRPVTKVWNTNKKWVLEIDSMLFTDGLFNPGEMTSMLLHEIGHVVYSNTIPQRVSKVIKMQLMKVNYQTRRISKKSKLSKLFELALIEACTQKIYRVSRREYEADKFVVKSGYGKELESLISKLLKTQGTSFISKPEGELDKEIEITVKWAIENIIKLRLRRSKLKKMIDVQIFKTPSHYVKSLLRYLKGLFTNDQDIYKDALMEQNIIKQHDKIVEEGLLSFLTNIGKVKKINKVDIDIIDVDITRIENQDDKIYMLDRIYDVLEAINLALELLDTGKADKVQQSRSTLLAYKSRLEKMRDKVLKYKVKDKAYGVFVQYPEGYEG